jgi:hypothetical protein
MHRLPRRITSEIRQQATFFSKNCVKVKYFLSLRRGGSLAAGPRKVASCELRMNVNFAKNWHTAWGARWSRSATSVVTRGWCNFPRNCAHAG